MKNKKAFTFLCAAAAVATIALIAALWYYTSPYKKAHMLISAIEANDTDRVQQLLEDGADPNQTDIPPSAAWSIFEMSARRPLSIAAANGDLGIVKLLIDYGATADYMEYTGWSPLNAALFRYEADDVEIVQLLLENGADPEIVESGKNAIFAAADMRPYPLEEYVAGNYDEEIARGITNIVQMLLADRSVDISTENGMTLLMFAARRENLFLVQYLLELGCDPLLTDYQGKTAADYAKAAGADNILRILAEANMSHITGDGFA